MDVIDAKKPAKFGLVAFVASILSIPIWATVLLPFTFLSCTVNFFYYNLGKLFTSNIIVTTTAKKNDNATTSNTEERASTIQTNNGQEENSIVNNNIIIPREGRKYDVILFGATGFVGKLAVSYLAKEYSDLNNNDNNNNNKQQQQQRVKWAIAGRSKSKLHATLAAIGQELGGNEYTDILNNVDVIIADTSDQSTLKGLVENTRSIASTVGPFQKYGSPLVEYCAMYGTHYADITGEVPWNKEMMRLYDHSARQSGAKIVSFCGHDSIPWDVTVRYLSNTLREECNDELGQVECLNELVGGVSGGTLATVFESIGILVLVGTSYYILHDNQPNK